MFAHTFIFIHNNSWEITIKNQGRHLYSCLRYCASCKQRIVAGFISVWNLDIQGLFLDYLDTFVLFVGLFRVDRAASP